jgi:hypothetical protein
MDRIAFVIPIHPPYYHHIYRFLESLPPNSVHVYLVFSSQGDADVFCHQTYTTAIVIPPGLTYETYSGAGIVDFKKFYALSKLKDAPHDYFIVCDAETQLVVENFTPENVLGKIESLFANKKIYAGRCAGGDGGNTINGCRVFRGEQRERLRYLTDDYTFQFWWSDLPVYKREHLRHFFEVCPIPDTIYSRPDHTVYQCYLVLYHGFTFVNYTPHIKVQSSLEGFVTKDTEKIHTLSRLGYGHAWVTSSQYSINHEVLGTLGTFLVYHLDRWTTPDFWDGR